MTFHKSRTYWLEHPEHGTFRARLEIVSTNGKSLGFTLEESIALRVSRPIGGIAFGQFLPVIHENGVFRDIITGSAWTVYTSEPADKIPTK